MQWKNETGIEKSPNIRALNELIQKWIKEAKLQLHSRSILSVVKVFDTPLS